ncbi:VOC family protein [Streptomyces sp. NPDC088923]|uniref:VOC family protein n=1 Tax=Streptomyces sp. NPDC088923 TaxID=3365913 RepID=UPI00382BD3EE
MHITHVLAVAPVTDHEAAVDWYARLLGRPADARPMPGLADWHLTDGGWLQVFTDPDRAGKALINLAVTDLDTELATLAAHGIAAGAATPGKDEVRFAAVHDPSGNRVTLIERPAVG